MSMAPCLTGTLQQAVNQLVSQVPPVLPAAHITAPRHSPHPPEAWLCDLRSYQVMKGQAHCASCAAWVGGLGTVTIPEAHLGIKKAAAHAMLHVLAQSSSNCLQ